MFWGVLGMCLGSFWEYSGVVLGCFGIVFGVVLCVCGGWPCRTKTDEKSPYGGEKVIPIQKQIRKIFFPKGGKSLYYDF